MEIKNLVDAVKYLLSQKEGLENFTKSDPISYHHTIGRLLRNNWNLWDKNSPLHRWFNSIGIYHADDMSGIILDTTHRILSKRKVDLKGQIEKYLKD